MAKKTPTPIRKTVSFKYRNFKCYEHIKDIDNFSEYVCRLIELDMVYDLLNRGLPNIDAIETKHRPVSAEPKEQPKAEPKEENVDSLLGF